jgi:NADH:ubiquinone oxidoreductase subunit 5 (subunit L)/multisubunit Na+/H+ antiporter MnhA subunit
LFTAYKMPAVAALALTAALYHVASHAFFKSLLFVATGAVLHATSERSLGKLGSLVRTIHQRHGCNTEACRLGHSRPHSHMGR